jgi:hypothetical protein
MLFCKCSGMAMFLGLLSLNGVAAAGPSLPDPVEQPPAATVAKLIARLGDADFRSRQEASDKLAQFGDPVLPALRKAATANFELEVKRRIELVVTRIENALLKAEEKCWQDLDAPRRSIKDRIGKIMARTPTLSNQQLASAVYLLTLGRPPTGDEVKQVHKQLVETNVRALSVLQLARSLVQSKEFSAEVAAANVRISKLKQDLAGEMGLAQKLARLNGVESQKLADELAASVDKAVKPDAHFVDVAFLLGTSRFPTASESKTVLAHLKKVGSRQTATSDVFWSMINTREFHLVE